ncbi:MAG: histidine kinase [Lewinellaceae bacterium]|nr:histidine kinase [Lewinellaceae bacterium]
MIGPCGRRKADAGSIGLYIAGIPGIVANPAWSRSGSHIFGRHPPLPFTDMNLFGNNITSDRLTRWLFILTFFGIWYAAPFIPFDNDNSWRQQFFLKILPASLTNIALFFLNTEWLAPRLLRRRGIVVYLVSLLGVAVFFIVLQGVMKNWLLAPDSKGVVFHAYKALFPVLFVAAVSTGYALVLYMLEGEKARVEERQERLQSELSFLRSQISPHFIFNILNSIVYLIRSGSANAEPVTIKLSELMRYMLYESNDAQILLEKEISYLNNYIELQKIRFEEDVAIHVRLQGDPVAHTIEPMLMIPFVENAFKHGVGLVDQPVIEIDLQLDERELRFKVRNKIAPGAQNDKDSSSGIGLQNVRRRLELLYPGAHRLDIVQNDTWFEVELWLKLGRPHGQTAAGLE